MKNTEINKLQKLSYLLLRVMGSGIFLVAALGHLFNPAGPAARLEKALFGFLATAIAPAETLVFLTGFVLLFGGIMLLLGYKTRLASVLLMLVLMPITVTVQIGSAATVGPLFKNIALFGILFFFIVNGAKHYSLDNWLNRKKLNQALLNSGSRLIAVAAVFMLLLSGCAAVLPAPSQATEKNAVASEKTNYVMLISQPDHLRAAVNTAQTLRKDAKYNAGEIVVMACAKSVHAFKNDSEFKAVFAAGKAAGITYKLCGMSLNKFKITESELYPGTEVVPNGLTYMFELKMEDYITVEL
ncbi:MAG: DoxX family membrane protein [Hymenobacteraceae bacterium]|nr:DoxX family membrane protein [Hymenobacteraceae bacterium]MDX5394566.1 DoxX family membrane protein [Hymenobacteraceae bacterium]MDX5510587.1 DoxX family membrane protein [Hymenobacteraceae bacterium]